MKAEGKEGRKRHASSDLQSKLHQLPTSQLPEQRANTSATEAASACVLHEGPSLARRSLHSASAAGNASLSCSTADCVRVFICFLLTLFDSALGLFRTFFPTAPGGASASSCSSAPGESPSAPPCPSEELRAANEQLVALTSNIEQLIRGMATSKNVEEVRTTDATAQARAQAHASSSPYCLHARACGSCVCCLKTSSTFPSLASLCLFCRVCCSQDVSIIQWKHKQFSLLIEEANLQVIHVEHSEQLTWLKLLGCHRTLLQELRLEFEQQREIIQQRHTDQQRQQQQQASLGSGSGSGSGSGFLPWSPNDQTFVYPDAEDDSPRPSIQPGAAAPSSSQQRLAMPASLPTLAALVPENRVAAGRHLHSPPFRASASLALANASAPPPAHAPGLAGAPASSPGVIVAGSSSSSKWSLCGGRANVSSPSSAAALQQPGQQLQPGQQKDAAEGRSLKDMEEGRNANNKDKDKGKNKNEKKGCMCGHDKVKRGRSVERSPACARAWAQRFVEGLSSSSSHFFSSSLCCCYYCACRLFLSSDLCAASACWC